MWFRSTLGSGRDCMSGFGRWLVGCGLWGLDSSSVAGYSINCCLIISRVSTDSLARVVARRWDLLALSGWGQRLWPTANIGWNSRHSTFDFSSRIVRCWSVTFFDSCLGVLSRLGWLGYKLFDCSLVIVFSFKSHSSFLALQSFNLYFFIYIPTIHKSWPWNSCRHRAGVLSSGKLFLWASVFNVDSQSLGGEESEPLEGLWIQTHLGKSIVPIWQTKMHNHQSEVVSKSVGDEEPLTGKILEPDLGLGWWVFED